jgi:endoglucanase
MNVVVLISTKFKTQNKTNMKKIKPNTLLLAMAILTIFINSSFLRAQPSIPANSPAGINGKLKVIGNSLCNQYDKPIQLRGMSTHGIQWFYDACYGSNKRTAFDTLKSWGADILRVSMYIQEDGYDTDPTGFTNKVKMLIDVATARGMYVLVDFHQLDPGDPNYNTATAKTFFTALATACKDYPNVIYEICNEPNGSTVAWAVIKQYADQVIPVIRAIVSDAVVLCGTHGWATFGFSNGDALKSAEGYKSVVNNKLNYPNLMYTFHFYAGSHNDQYLTVLDSASNALPVFVTEFGFQNAAGEGKNNKTMTDKYITLMRNKKISWCNWNYSDDSRTGAVWKNGGCASNNWTTSNLKEAGIWVRDYIRSPADDFLIATINISPTVNITSPVHNYSANTGTNITLTATAADKDGSITKVAFFYGATLIGTSTISPFSVEWNAVPAGTHQLTAKATDDKSATTTSATVTLIINAVQSPFGTLK